MAKRCALLAGTVAGGCVLGLALTFVVFLYGPDVEELLT